MSNLKEHLQSLALPLHRSFVAPILCKDLFADGIKPPQDFVWKIRNGEGFIWSQAFDPDDYYKKSASVIDSLFCEQIIPAYQAADMEKIIGPFIHIHSHGAHEVSPSDLPRIGVRKAPRYADALALVVIELLNRRIIDRTKANQLLYEK